MAKYLKQTWPKTSNEKIRPWCFSNAQDSEFVRFYCWTLGYSRLISEQTPSHLRCDFQFPKNVFLIVKNKKISKFSDVSANELIFLSHFLEDFLSKAGIHLAVSSKSCAVSYGLCQDELFWLCWCSDESPRESHSELPQLWRAKNLSAPLVL